MQTIQDIEKAITLNGELLSETKKRIEQTASKLSGARGNAENIQVEIKSLKEQRQQALAKGGDSKTPNDSLKKLEAQQELETETITGLETFIRELQAEEGELHLKINALPKRILQLRSIELAAQYNSLASQLAPVIEELNSIYNKTAGNSNNRDAAVVFYPMEGCFEKLPRIFYDPDGCGLETFVSRHPGKYHTNVMLSETEKYFYSWALHQNSLRS